MRENVIEWITGEDTISCTFTQKKYINKVRKLADKRPDLVPILKENRDGSIFCHLPLKALKLYVKTSVKPGVDDTDDTDDIDDFNEDLEDETD